MYSVSEAYLPAFRKLYRTDRITGRIKLKNGTNIILSNEMLVQGGFTITRKVCGSSYDIGTFNAGEVSLSLRDDAAKELDFGGAVMAANYELVTGGTADNPVWETVPLGVFYIDGQQTTRRGKNITLRGFDGTSKFDIGLPLLDSVTTLWDGLVQACLRANVGLAVEEAWFKALPNADITPNYTSKKIQSCRDLVMWIAQTVGCCAFIDRSGFLQLKKYHYNGDGTFNRAITAAERTKIEYTDTRTYLAYLTSYSGGSPKLYTDVRQWTGTDTIKEGGLSIPNNPLLLTLTSEQQDAVNQALMSESSYPTRYIKSTGFVDPAIDLMDVLAFTGGTIDIGQIISVCTEIKWKYRGSGHVICNNLDQYSQDADSADAANAMTLSDDGTAAQSETTPAFMPAKSQLEKRVDALEAAGSGGGSISLGALDTYTYLTDNSIEYNGLTYTIEKDDTGLITRITDDDLGEFEPKNSGNITDVAFHNAVLTAVAMLCGLPKPQLDDPLTAMVQYRYNLDSYTADGTTINWLNQASGIATPFVLTGATLADGGVNLMGTSASRGTMAYAGSATEYTIYLVANANGGLRVLETSGTGNYNTAACLWGNTGYWQCTACVSGTEISSAVSSLTKTIIAIVKLANGTYRLYINGERVGTQIDGKDLAAGNICLTYSTKWGSSAGNFFYYDFALAESAHDEADIITNSKYLMRKYGI